MAKSPPSGIGPELADRLEQVGRTLGARESRHVGDLREARLRIGEVRHQVQCALKRFHVAVSDAGAPHLRVEVSEIRIDEKHLRAVEFDVTRGRHKAIVVGKSRGEITLVGPFRTGKTEGPCKSIPFGDEAELDRALGDFLTSFLEEAATP
ncbi:MAG: hypothetical protein AAEJ52_18330 [Myxococcota bacterium]